MPGLEQAYNFSLLNCFLNVQKKYHQASLLSPHKTQLEEMLEVVKFVINGKNFILTVRVVSGVKSVVCRGVNVQVCIG